MLRATKLPLPHYRKTFGDNKVDIVISVEGSNENITTIDIFPGYYTVTEISDADNTDRAWRYVNKDTYDTLHKNDIAEEKYTGEHGDWDVDISDFKSAYTELRYRNDDPVLDHHYVTFEYVKMTRFGSAVRTTRTTISFSLIRKRNKIQIQKHDSNIRT